MVPFVHLIEPVGEVGDPAPVVLGGDDPELGVAVEDPSEDQQRQGLLHLVDDAHHAEHGDAGAKRGIAAHGPGEDVEGHRPAPLGEGGPQGIETGLGVVALGRHARNHGTLQARVMAALDLVHGGAHVDGRDHGQAGDQCQALGAQILGIAGQVEIQRRQQPGQAQPAVKRSL